MLNEHEYITLRNALTVDPNALDNDLINIAMQQISIAEYAAEAATAKAHAEFQYDQVVADTSAGLRASDEKPSEARIKSEVYLYDAVLQAHNDVVEAERDYALWRGLADAIRTKNGAIGHISDLIKAGYMSSTSIRHDRRETIQQYRETQQPSYGNSTR